MAPFWPTDVRRGAGMGTDSAMPPGRDVASRSRIHLRDFPRGEELLLLNDDSSAAIPSLRVGPDARSDVSYGIGDVCGTIVADLALRALRRVAGDREVGVDQQVEPIGGFLDLRTSLGPDHAIVCLAGNQGLHVICYLREHRTRRR